MLDPAEFFARAGTLSRVHPTYEHRPGQASMAEAVARTLEQGGTLMIEAGTGTGKTLAYLVPALASGRRVVVSTGTRNLQDQIFTKDLPFLAEKAGIEISASVMKGRENYLCRYRMAQVEREPLLEDLNEAPWVGRIAEWSQTTTSGDRAEIADLPDRLRLWRDVNARADTCTGSRCPGVRGVLADADEAPGGGVADRGRQSPPVLRRPRRAFRAFGAVLPEYDTVIFDEAHLLEEIATLYFGVQVSSGQLEDLARDAEKLAARTGGQTQGGAGAAALRLASREFFVELRERLRHEAGRARFDPASRGGPDLEAEWAVLSEALDDVARQTQRLSSGEDRTESLPRRAEELCQAFERVLDREKESHVYGMELRGRATVLLTAAPIDVSQMLRERLFEPLTASVLTSATMTVDGRFDFFRRRLGLEQAETVVAVSSFDHAEQAALYLPRRMPPPSDAGFIDRAVEEIVPLLETTEGRAFLLFTSYANMQRVHDALQAMDRWSLLLQGEGSKVALVERFRTTARAVLLGTTSFWHGVDVPGEALSLVVVDKLPFDVPSDPLIAARIDRIRREGGNPFAEYQVPLAVLELKQGLGRLLRSREDRGILAVLDPRLTTRGYGRTFLRSLPPYRRVHTRPEYDTFFRGAGSASLRVESVARPDTGPDREEPAP